MRHLTCPDKFYGWMGTEDHVRIPQAEQEVLERHAQTIRETQNKTRRNAALAVLRIGEELSAAQTALAKHGDGTFTKWCVHRCGISKSSAYRAIAVYTTFRDRPNVGQTFEASALYALSADSTPEEATEEALKLAEKGELITAKKAREIVRKHSEEDEDQNQDQDDDEQNESLTWDPCECLRDVRREVMRWKQVCPKDQIGELKNVLREMLDQFERTEANAETDS